MMFHFKYFMENEINELYITNTIRMFAVSMISIFVPIFLLKQGYRLVDVALYVLLHYNFSLITTYYALKFSAKRGVKHSIYISVPLMILFYYILYHLDYLLGHYGLYSTLLVISFVESVAGAFYWMGFHIEFSKFSRKTMSQLGILNILSTIFSIVAPLLGAIVITSYSFDTLFLVVIVLLAISVIPLLFSDEVHEPFSFNVKKAKNKLAFFGEGMHNIGASVWWPILLFYFAISLKDIGSFYAISNTLVVIVTYVVSRMDKGRVIGIGALLHSITLWLRPFFKTPLSAGIIQGFGGLTWPLLNIPFHAYFYENARKHIGSAIYNRESFLSVGRVSSAVILIILTFFLNNIHALQASIVIAGISTLFMAKIKK